MELTSDSARTALAAAALQLNLDLSDAETDALLRYLAFLQRWNATYNLTSVREPDQMLKVHLIDCLSVITSLRRKLSTGSARLLDVGSGAGLPGVVIAILNPAMSVTCVDSVGKKAAFVQQVGGELRLRNLQVRHTRVEAITETFDVIVSRAFGSLDGFVRITERRLSVGGVWAAMKGKYPGEELAELGPNVEVFHVEQLDVPCLEAQRCIVWMRPNPTL
jgi:16S rRNA (guanine527-N7)-methyltransferase